MDILTIISAFMLAVGSPTWVVNYYEPTALGVEVDVQTTTDPASRYLLLITSQGVVATAKVPVDDLVCQKESH